MERQRIALAMSPTLTTTPIAIAMVRSKKPIRSWRSRRTTGDAQIPSISAYDRGGRA